VAELVTEGKTNREIAGHLFLSEKGVESHLRRIFDKLDIRSRDELHRILLGLSNVAVWEQLAAGGELDSYLGTVPDEWYAWLQATVAELRERYAEVERAVQEEFARVRADVGLAGPQSLCPGCAAEPLSPTALPAARWPRLPSTTLAPAEAGLRRPVPSSGGGCLTADGRGLAAAL